MALHYTYVGLLNDPKFRWDGGSWTGNTPTVIGSFFPDGHVDPFWRVVELAETSADRGRQVDWAAWAVKITKAEIRDFVEEVYGPGKIVDGLYGPNATNAWADSARRTWAEAVQRLKDFVETLEDDESYVLVAMSDD